MKSAKGALVTDSARSRASTCSSREVSLTNSREDRSPAYASEEDSSDGADELGWLWRPHASVSHHAHLAVRVAAGTALVILPLLLQRHSNAFLDTLRDRGIVMRSDVAMYLYTVSVSTGQTIELAYCALIGTFLSVANIWVMLGIFPSGYHKDSPESVFWIMVANGVVFTFLILYLKLAMNTRIFALSSFVYHFMTFIDPSKDTGFSKSFTLDFDSTETKEFKAASIGCMLAILVTMIPWPFWANKRARFTAERLVNALDYAWQECSRIMCSSEVDPYAQDQVRKQLSTLEADMDVLGADIYSSLMEQFGRPRARDRRKMLARLHEMLGMCYDDIRNVWSNCLAETFGNTHDRLMSLIRHNVGQVISEAGMLMKAATAAACLGHIDKGSAEELEARCARTRQATRALTLGFLDAKATLQQGAIDMELIDEHCFCLNLCTYGRVVCEFAEALVEHSRGKKLLPGAPGYLSCASVWDICDDWDFAKRNFITIALGIFVGYHGYYNRFRKYDAGIASTLAILLSKYSGSALAKNLQRIQGVVIGTILGQLVYALLAWCSWWGYASTMAFNFVWVSVTYFVYFHIPGYSTIACLMGVFGTTNMIGIPLARVGCSSDMVETEHLIESYYDIVNVCTALFLSSAVDLLLGKSAKVMASEAILDVWQDLRQAIGCILDPDELTGQVCDEQLFGKIAVAKSLGAEASQELSLSTSAWRTDDFNFVIDSVHSLRIFLGSLVFTAVQGNDGGRKDRDFLLATQLHSFGSIRLRLMAYMDMVGELIQNFRPESRCGFARPPARKPYRKTLSISLLEGSDLERFLDEARLVQWEATDFSLENDGPSQVCALIAAVQAMQREVRELHRRLRPAEEASLPLV